MENKKNEKQQNINEGLFLNYLKLLSQSIYEYSNLHPWNSFPSINELNDIEIKNKMKKKIEISLSILLKKTKEKNHKELEHLILFEQNVLKDNDALNKTTKLSLLISSVITRTKIIKVIDQKQKIEDLMVEYLQMIMKNFHSAYQNSIYGFYESISNNLCIINNSKFIFDYEYAFLYDRDYFDNELIPKIKEEIKKLNIFFNDDIINDINFNDIDLNNFQQTKLFSIILEQLKNYKIEMKNLNEEENENKKKLIKSLISNLKKK